MHRYFFPIFFLLLNFFTGMAFAKTEYSIVYIYVGGGLPNYLETSLAQARLFNPECPILLVADKEALRSANPVLQKHRIKAVARETLKRSTAHNLFLQTYTYKEGLGLYSSERFFYLDELMKRYKMKNVFHLELDVMLYADLKRLLPVFMTRYPGIAATFDNDHRCIPGFVYIANSKAMKKWAQFFAQHAREGHLDMQLTGFFKNATNPKTIDYLPIVMEEYISQHTLQSPSGDLAKKPGCFCNNFKLFQSIFDAAAMGQYLGGTHNSPPGFINEGCVFNPAFFMYEWIEDSEGRKVPHALFGNKKYRINTLHIHSKKLHLFTS